MTTTTRLLLASSNPAKLARLRGLVDGLSGLDLLEPGDLPPPPPSVEEGDRSLRDNAVRKATAWACAYRVAVLASDGGLSVPGLGRRWRAVRTRRAAGEAARPEEHARHLLGLMHGLIGAQRRAYQREAVALVAADGGLLGAWESHGPRRFVAERFEPRGLPAGFWVPGVLTPAPGLDDEAHWDHLRAPVRAAVLARLLSA